MVIVNVSELNDVILKVGMHKYVAKHIKILSPMQYKVLDSKVVLQLGFKPYSIVDTLITYIHLTTQDKWQERIQHIPQAAHHGYSQNTFWATQFRHTLLYSP